MKRNLTPRFKDYLRSKLGPRQSTIDFILRFSATYQVANLSTLSKSLPGFVLN